MSWIKKKLEEYQEELKRKSFYKEGLPGSSLDIVETLLDGLKKERIYDIDKITICDGIACNGEETQSIVCMEECAELTQAISKELRGKHDPEHLMEEMADVIICIEILKEIHHFSEQDINEWIQKKQQREKKRLWGNGK